MIGVCIPAHNEEAIIGRCLASVAIAARHPELDGEPVEIVVVLDGCTDNTAERASRWNLMRIEIDQRDVGRARAFGADYLLGAGARWLAFTDADTVVSERWLIHQLSLRTPVVCGTVGVDNWECHGPYADTVRAAFHATYEDRDGHRHVHGANLGIDARAYREIGGFDTMGCREDQDLVDRLEAAGVTIAWSALPRVLTSARPESRITGGFASALRGVWPDQQKFMAA